MAISYVGGKTAGFVGATSGVTTVALNSGLTGGSDSGVSAGDLVVVTVGFVSLGATPTGTISNPSGYSGLTQQDRMDATYRVRHKVSYKFMGSTPDTSVDIPPSLATNCGGTYDIHVYRGVDQTTPLDVTEVYATALGTGRPNPAAITPTTAGAWIHVSGHQAVSVGAVLTTTDLSGFLSSFGDDNNDINIGVGYYSSWTSGSFDPAIFGGGTTSSSGQSWATTTIALRPAAVSLRTTILRAGGIIGF